MAVVSARDAGNVGDGLSTFDRRRKRRSQMFSGLVSFIFRRAIRMSDKYLSISLGRTIVKYNGSERKD